MHPTRFAGPGRLAAALLLLLAACGDGGGPVPVADPDDLEISILDGGGQRATVRPPGDQPADSLLVRVPVVLRVSVVRDVEGEDGATGPSRRVRLPDGVTVHWRTLEPFCQVVHATTQLAPGTDTTSNQYVRPTRSGICRVEAAATVEGRPIGAPDTAAVHFAAGPPVRAVSREPIVAMTTGTAGEHVFRFMPRVFDVYDNLVEDIEFSFTFAITKGAPNFAIRDVRGGFVWAPEEGYGAVTATYGTVSATSEAWALDFLPFKSWRLSWECYGMQRPDGAVVDSVHHQMDPAAAEYGGLNARGLTTSFRGTVTRREWVRGQPMRETRQLGATVFAGQRPDILTWSPGQVSQAVPTGYRGGTLCEPGPDGAAWTRTSPMRVDRL
ncbi:MAG TPA: hypothetical protein VGC13_27475 [Longimicrobium sp.]|jgi:hypothetical protein|uniref:hypothetical protein n=1 Tax=Longimicrobium sp. TaxID=2029185 RepID=UPI002ED851FD